MRLLPCLLLAGGAAVAQVTGVWIGSLESSQRNVPAHLVLKQEGTSLSGTAGPSEGMQLPIRKGVAKGDGSYAFEIVEGQAVMRFDLRLVDGRLSGVVHREQDGSVQDSTLTATRRPGEQAPPDLTKTVVALDAGLFAAYNTCDIEKFSSYIGSSIEFFHDQSGLTDRAEGVVQALKLNVCGKVRRELVSIEVYPIPGYGALEFGTHKFFNRASGVEEGGDKVAKFLHVWQHKNGEWKLTRVASFAH